MSSGGRHPLPGMLLAVAALGACGLLGGCTSYTGSPAHQVAEWASIAGVSANDQLVVQDIAALRLSVRKDLLKDVTSNCSGLVFDAGTADGNLPTPNNSLTNQLNAAYQDFVSGGSSCAAARSVHSGQVVAALRTIAAGAVILDEAERRLASDGVH